MIVDIEIFVEGIDFLHAQSFQSLDELLENEFHSFFDGIWVVGVGVGQSAFEIVEHGQDGRDGFLATVQDELSLFFQGALLVVLEFSDGAQQLVAQFGVLFLHGFQRVFFLFGFLCSFRIIILFCVLVASFLVDGCLLFHRFNRFCGYFVAKIVVFFISRKRG